MEVFQQLKHFPDPTPEDDVHYLTSASIYGPETNEEHRPSKKEDLKSSGHCHSMVNYNMYVMQI